MQGDGWVPISDAQEGAIVIFYLVSCYATGICIFEELVWAGRNGYPWRFRKEGETDTNVVSPDWAKWVLCQ